MGCNGLKGIYDLSYQIKPKRQISISSMVIKGKARQGRMSRNLVHRNLVRLNLLLLATAMQIVAQIGKSQIR